MDKEKLAQFIKMVKCAALILVAILIWEGVANALPSAQDLVNVIGLMRPGDSALPFINALNRDDSLFYDLTTTNNGFNIHLWNGNGTSTVILEHDGTRILVGANYAVYTGDRTKAAKLQNEIIQYVAKSLKQQQTSIMGKEGFRFTSTELPHVFFVETGANFISLTQCFEDKNVLSGFAIAKDKLRF